MGGLSGRLLGGGRRRRRVSVPQTRPARDHVCDVVAGELGQLVPTARLSAHQQAEHESAFLLEEEDVTWLLVVHVPPDDSERCLVATGGSRGHAAPASCAG